MGNNGIDPINHGQQQPPTPAQLAELKGKMEQLRALAGQQQQRPAWTSVFKRVEALGIRLRIMPVMLSDEPVKCLVLPVDQLIMAEYKEMSGVDPASLQEQGNLATIEQGIEEQAGD